MRHTWRFLGFSATLLLVGYFLWFATINVNFSALHHILSPFVLAMLFAAAILYALIIPLTGWAWSRLLTAQGESWPISLLTSILAVTQLAKYLPGNIAQHASRAALSLRQGISTRALTASVLQETLFAIASSIIIGLALLSISRLGLSQIPQSSHTTLAWLIPTVLISVLVLASIPLPPTRLTNSPHRTLRLLGQLGGLPGARVALPALLAYSFNYIIIGFGLWLLARSAEMPAALDLPLITGAFALSWLLGFLAPGVPAGLGVREGILVILLSGAASDSQLLAFVLLTRLVTLLGDAINFIMGTLWFAFTKGAVR